MEIKRVVTYKEDTFTLQKGHNVYKVDEKTGVITLYPLKLKVVQKINKVFSKDKTEYHELPDDLNVRYIPAASLHKAYIKAKFAYSGTGLKIINPTVD